MLLDRKVHGMKRDPEQWRQRCPIDVLGAETLIRPRPQEPRKVVIVLDRRLGIAVSKRDDLRLEIARQGQITSHRRNFGELQASRQCRVIPWREKDRSHLLDAHQVAQGVETLTGTPRRLPKRPQTNVCDLTALLCRERRLCRAKDQSPLKAPHTESTALRFDPLTKMDVMDANGVQRHTNDASGVLGLDPTGVV